MATPTPTAETDHPHADEDNRRLFHQHVTSIRGGLAGITRDQLIEAMVHARNMGDPVSVEFYRHLALAHRVLHP